MFSIFSVSSCDFPSTWKSLTNSQKTEAESQTDVIEQKEAKIQVIKKVHAEIQAGSSDMMPKKSTQKQYDKPSLYAFLKRATPIMIQELERNARSAAFRHLQQRTRQQHLEQLNVLEYHEAARDYAALSVAVSNIRSTELAVGYGTTQHVDWCDHRAKLVLFKRKDLSARPRVYDMDSCVSCVAYNDRKPILTCGMYTGEVLSWDGEEQLQVRGLFS